MKMVPRPRHTTAVSHLMEQFPVVGIIGARQVGKTTLAKMIAADFALTPVEVFDLEDPRDRARLADPMLALEPLRGLVVLDEVQRLPEVFQVLRVLADRPETPARFLVLGSAGPDLLRQGSESLAGRIAYYEVPPLQLDEVPAEWADELWLRGGFPRSFLAESEERSALWRREFVRTFTERDLPQLGIGVASETMRRFWTMLAHTHGHTLNASASRSSAPRHRTSRPPCGSPSRTFAWIAWTCCTRAARRSHWPTASELWLPIGSGPTWIPSDPLFRQKDQVSACQSVDPIADMTRAPHADPGPPRGMGRPP